MKLMNWFNSILWGVAVGGLAMLIAGSSSSMPTGSTKPDRAIQREGAFLLDHKSMDRAVWSHSDRMSQGQEQEPFSDLSIDPARFDSQAGDYIQLCQALSLNPNALTDRPDSSAPAAHSATDQSDASIPPLSSSAPVMPYGDDCFVFPVAGKTQEELPSKYMRGVDENTPHRLREPHWHDRGKVPWEQYAYGEYLGPYRTPHVDEYRVRVGDQIECNYLQTREKLPQRYQLNIGDLIQISSAIDSSLNQPAFAGNNLNGLQIMPDGTVSLILVGEVRAAGKTVEDLQRELNEKYFQFIKNPSITVQVTKSETPVADLLDAVDSRFGQGGRSRQVTVSPDGTIQLPMIGSIPSIGLTLSELGREINARYRERIQGVEITPILIQRAPRFVYVLGEVKTAGRYELTAPTTAMQAVALAGGFDRRSGNVRQVIVFRRDKNWQLIATKLDLGGALAGRSPLPSDEIWLRDSDIVLIPAKPIQRFSDAVNLYMTNTLYAIFPQQGVAFNFDQFRSL
jgi:polysaccharide biosynthesis/export protein